MRKEAWTQFLLVALAAHTWQPEAFSPDERGFLPQTKMLLLLMPFKQKEGKRIKIIIANSFASMGLHIK